MTSCKLNFDENGKDTNEEVVSNKDYTPSFVRQTVQWYRDTFGVSSNVDVKRAAELDDLDAREVYARHLAEMGAVNPEDFNRIHSWLAAKFNQINKMMFDPNNMSAEGQVRLNFLDIKRISTSLVENIAKYQQLQTLKKVTGEVYDVLAQYGYKGQRAQELFQEFIEYGHIPEKSIAYASDAARTFNNLRYEKWKKALLDSGMVEDDFNLLISQAYEYASIPRQMRDAAKSLGVDVGDLDGIGYFTRVMTKEFEMYFKDIIKTQDPELYNDLVSGKQLFSTVFNKARSTSTYVPNVALDTFAAMLSKFTNPEEIKTLNTKLKDELSVLRRDYQSQLQRLKQSKKDFFADVGEPMPREMYSNAKQALTDKYEAQVASTNARYKSLIDSVGMTPDHLLKMLEDPIGWREFLDTIPSGAIDTMVESGLMQQLPMTSKEVFEYFAKRYELPFQSSGELFMTDPQAVLSKYGKSLGNAAGNSRIWSYLSTRGVEEGWAISYKTFQESTNLNKDDYVQLKDIDWESVGIDPVGIKNNSLYIHKNVAEQLKAVMYISSNPANMSNFASGVQRVMSQFRLTVLAKEAWRYTGRVLVTNTIQSLQGSGLDPRSIPLYFQGIIDVTKAATQGLDFLDDTEPVIKIGDTMYTKRGAMQQLLMWRSNEYVPMTPGDSVDVSSKGRWLGDVFGMYSPQTVQRAMAFAEMSSKGSNNPFKYSQQLGKYYVSQMTKGMQAWFAPFATFANMSDIAARWSILQLKGGEFKNVQEALRYTDEYIYSPDASGTFAKSWGSVVKPFLSYAVYNPPAQIRAALRNPSKFTAYHKMLSFMSRSASRPCSDTPEAGFAPWMLEGAPVTIGCDGKNPLVMHIQSIDPSSDTLSYLNETGELITSLRGGFSGTSQEQRQQALRDSVATFFNSQLNETYWRGAYSLMTNTNLDTGREFDNDEIVTWNGFEISPRFRAFLDDVPIPGAPAPIVTFNELNRMNPFDIWGRQSIKDAYGRVVRPEKLSIFNTRRTDRDARYDDAVAKNETLKLMRMLGLSINVARVAENVQNSEGRIESDLREMRSRLSKHRNKYLDEYKSMPEGERRKRYETINEMAQRVALVEIDLMRLRLWMQQNKIPPGQVFDKYKELSRKVQSAEMLNQSIPMPDINGQTRVINEYYETIKGLDNDKQQKP